jgi:hypothetical protein
MGKIIPFLSVARICDHAWIEDFAQAKDTPSILDVRRNGNIVSVDTNGETFSHYFYAESIAKRAEQKLSGLIHKDFCLLAQGIDVKALEAEMNTPPCDVQPAQRENRTQIFTP